MIKKGLNLKDYALKENVPLWKMYRIRDMFFAEIPIYQISKNLRIHNTKATRIVNWFLADKSLRTQIVKSNTNPIQYWKNEKEMEIQEYRIEDLTGEEKEIFIKLNQNEA